MSACGCDTSGLKPVDEAIAELLGSKPKGGYGFPTSPR